MRHLLRSLCVLSHFSHAWCFETLWTVALQAPLSMSFFRQEHWSGLPCSPPECLPNPEIEPASPAKQADFCIHWTKVFSSLFSEVVCSFLLSFKSFFYIWSILSQNFCKYFIPVWCLSTHSLAYYYYFFFFLKDYRGLLQNWDSIFNQCLITKATSNDTVCSC